MNSEFSSSKLLESMLKYGSSGPRNLPLEYLRNITNNFSNEQLIGEGGFGTVYKGVLPNGETIAVKKLNSSMPGVKDRQFENEVFHLMRLKHPNIVLLVGWCFETENIYVEYHGKYICAEKSERLLCLEYMPKGNLRGYLSDESSGLTWQSRYKIIKGICYGLLYLHEEKQLNGPIIHMDLKPANILLDNNMVPKIADFGLSRLFTHEKTRTFTISRVGTLGYMAPEYINKGLISTKSDIFSLGVIIIEIVTGQRDYPDESETGLSSQEFTELVLKNWRDRLQKSLRYASLEIDYQQIRRCIQIGLDCVKLDRGKRPTISQVIKMLHGAENADFSGRKEVCQQQLVREGPLEKEECQSSKGIRRSHALARLELDRPASLAVAGSAACSLGLVNSFTWDILRSFAPDGTDHAPGSRPARGFGHQDAVDNDEEEDAVSEKLSLGESSEFWTANSSLSSSNGDEASSTTIESEFCISPNGRFRMKIRSWLRGALRGIGSFGRVYDGISDEGFFFAVKEVNLFDQGSNVKQCIFQLEQEIALLSQFEHENIVQYFGTDKEDSYLYVFLELVTQGSLASLYQKYCLLDTEVSAYTRQILNGLTYLHERNIVHRDIKCANIMVDATGAVKLADFGLAKEITKFNAIKSWKGTVYWMAPEVVNPEKTYGPAADLQLTYGALDAPS